MVSISKLVPAWLKCFKGHYGYIPDEATLTVINLANLAWKAKLLFIRDLGTCIFNTSWWSGGLLCQALNTNANLRTYEIIGLWTSARAVNTEIDVNPETLTDFIDLYWDYTSSISYTTLEDVYEPLWDPITPTVDQHLYLCEWLGVRNVSGAVQSGDGKVKERKIMGNACYLH